MYPRAAAFPPGPKNGANAARRGNGICLRRVSVIDCNRQEEAARAVRCQTSRRQRLRTEAWRRALTERRSSARARQAGSMCWTTSPCSGPWVRGNTPAPGASAALLFSPPHDHDLFLHRHCSCTDAESSADSPVSRRHTVFGGTTLCVPTVLGPSCWGPEPRQDGATTATASGRRTTVFFTMTLLTVRTACGRTRANACAAAVGPMEARRPHQ